ncbi:MAG: hypothetical protein A3F14_00505 [Gammaproteobacteria bacterium RIFCSPHIGHO2_12_FULL_43_28]|nr:MAG: hypothetical protein A3F14_00505 [Gammaproteobacteria bacterium RIFCSPHIGHO2_12_FULL_43_28]
MEEKIIIINKNAAVAARTLRDGGFPRGGERSEGEAKRAILPLGCKQKLVFCAASKEVSLPALFSGNG